MVGGSSIRRRLESIDSRQINPGLDRIHKLLEALGDPQLDYPTAIIGGTNGKGSVAAMLTAMGRAAGHRIGLYTSPHLTAVEERFQINEIPISVSGLDSQLGFVFAAVDKHLDSPPSYFEILTAVAFRYFAEAQVDLAVLEVGLGGRWDATNVTRPRVAVISSVAMDHQEYLGNDLQMIAAEKAAIIPPGGIAVTAPQKPSVLEVIRQQAVSVEATLWETESFPLVVRSTDAQLCHTIDFASQLRGYVGLEVSLPGSHQIENAQCAILAAEALDRRRFRISSDAIWAGLRNTRWPGRCEWLEGSPSIILDAGHNPEAAQALATYLGELRRRKAFNRLHLVFSALADKDTEGIAQALYPLADHIVATRAPSERATTAQDLLSIGVPSPQSQVVCDPREALAAARAAAAPEDLICVCGSTYLVGSLRPLLVNT